MQAYYTVSSPHLFVLIGGMLIHICQVQTGTTIPLIMKPSDTIENVKDKIYEKGGIPPEHERLMYRGKELDNGCTLSDYEIEEEAMIYSVPVEIKGKYVQRHVMHRVM